MGFYSDSYYDVKDSFSLIKCDYEKLRPLQTSSTCLATIIRQDDSIQCRIQLIMENVTQSSRVILTWNICDHNLEYFINNTSHESYLLHPRPLSTQFKHQCWHQCQFSISIFDVGFSSCKTCHTVSFGGVNCDFRVRNLINYLDIFAAKNAYWQKYWVPTKKLSTEYILHYIYISRRTT